MCYGSIFMQETSNSPIFGLFHDDFRLCCCMACSSVLPAEIAGFKQKCLLVSTHASKAFEITGSCQRGLVTFVLLLQLQMFLFLKPVYQCSLLATRGTGRKSVNGQQFPTSRENQETHLPSKVGEQRHLHTRQTNIVSRIFGANGCTENIFIYKGIWKVGICPKLEDQPNSEIPAKIACSTEQWSQTQLKCCHEFLCEGLGKFRRDMKSNLLNGINLRSQSQALTNFIRNLRKILWPTLTFSYLQRNCESFQLTTLIYQYPNTLCLSITKYLFVAPQLVLVSEIPFAQHSAFICSCSRDEKETQSGVKI